MYRLIVRFRDIFFLNFKLYMYLKFELEYNEYMFVFMFEYVKCIL